VSVDYHAETRGRHGDRCRRIRGHRPADAGGTTVAPGDCQQFAFPGNVELVEGANTVRFFSTGSTFF
jgi:hypothetical protein